MNNTGAGVWAAEASATRAAEASATLAVVAARVASTPMGHELARLQACSDALTNDGSWVRSNLTSHVERDEAWVWSSSLAPTPGQDRSAACRLARITTLRRGLKGRWLLFVGDSRARMVYAALLHLLNGSQPLQLGWPTHQVPYGDECTPHVPAIGGRRESFGWYNPACQLPSCVGTTPDKPSFTCKYRPLIRLVSCPICD